VAFALVIFILGAWLFPLVALAIYMDSHGPIFYRQKRRGCPAPGVIGTGAARSWLFDMLKFRTMRVDAEKGGPVQF